MDYSATEIMRDIRKVDDFDPDEMADILMTIGVKAIAYEIDRWNDGEPPHNIEEVFAREAYIHLLKSQYALQIEAIPLTAFDRVMRPFIHAIFENDERRERDEL